MRADFRTTIRECSLGRLKMTVRKLGERKYAGLKSEDEVQKADDPAAEREALFNKLIGVPASPDGANVCSISPFTIATPAGSFHR